MHIMARLQCYNINMSRRFVIKWDGGGGWSSQQTEQPNRHKMSLE